MRFRDCYKQSLGKFQDYITRAQWRIERLIFIGTEVILQIMAVLLMLILAIPCYIGVIVFAVAIWIASGSNTVQPLSHSRTRNTNE